MKDDDDRSKTICPLLSCLELNSLSMLCNILGGTLDVVDGIGCWSDVQVPHHRQRQRWQQQRWSVRLLNIYLWVPVCRLVWLGHNNNPTAQKHRFGNQRNITQQANSPALATRYQFSLGHPHSQPTTTRIHFISSLARLLVVLRKFKTFRCRLYFNDNNFAPSDRERTTERSTTMDHHHPATHPTKSYFQKRNICYLDFAKLRTALTLCVIRILQVDGGK